MHLAYDLFLFDFDGLLVNTEELHFGAYRQMCALRGFKLNWDMRQFFRAAQFDAEGLKKAIYAQFPELFRQEPNWGVLYAEKKMHYQALLHTGDLKMMPGAEKLLQQLAKAGIRRCVVTNSPRVQVEAIGQRLPILHTIPVWITREDYKEPKPHPESYQTAIAKLARPGDRIIGFEDSTRGLKALLGAGVKEAVLISPPDHPQLEQGRPEVPCYETLTQWASSYPKGQ